MNKSFENAGSTLSSLLNGFCEVPPHLDRYISDITLDSREAQQGTCFFALSGTARRGSDFVSDAVCRGATAVVSETQLLLEPPSKVVCLVVPKLKDLIGKISSRFFGDPSKLLKMYAVTGTNGKTTVSYLMSKIIGALEGNCGYLGTLGIGLDSSREMVKTQNTTPDVITINRALRKFLTNGASSCALEASSIGLSQGRLDGLDIDTALYTNLGQDHLDYHGTQDAYEGAKFSLFERRSLKNVILNLDDEFGRTISERIYGDKKIFTVSSLRDLQMRIQPDISISEIDCTLSDSRFRVSYLGKIWDFKTQLLGRFNVSNVSLSIGGLLNSGYSVEDILKSLSEIGCVPGRMQSCGKSSRGAYVFVDYAHTPEGLNAALATLKPLSKGNISVVFGCGGDRDRLKRPEMGRIACKGADSIFLTSDNSRSEETEDIVGEILLGVSDKTRATIISDRFLAIKAAITSASNGDIVLIAGKGHEIFQEINGRKFEHNDFLTVKKILSEGIYG